MKHEQAIRAILDVCSYNDKCRFWKQRENYCSYTSDVNIDVAIELDMSPEQIESLEDLRQIVIKVKTSEKDYWSTITLIEWCWTLSFQYY